jgi:hypothetical protein
MNAKGLLLGASFGILAAAMLIAVVSLAGTGAHHIDLLSPGSQPAQLGSGVSTQVVGPSTSLGQQGSQTASPGQTTVATSSSGASLFGLISPLVLAAALGAAFYGLYTRRLNAE